ncbi:MAG: hypothetical protein U9R79_17570 [Armatimonadota bacterium]|nr:hypothetical protein [Armatimonadota bacterium]
MDERKAEEMLRQAGPPQPRLQVGEHLLRRAEPILRWRRIRRGLRLAIPAAAALLLAANLIFGEIYQARMAALVGPRQSVTVAADDPAAFAEAVAQRQRLMSEVMTAPAPEESEDERNGGREVPDLQTDRQRDRCVDYG